MPRGDGTGPPRGPAGRGGRMGGNMQRTGPEGNCICPACGEKLSHKKGVPCFNLICTKCGAKMVRA